MRPQILFISQRNPRTTAVRDGGVALSASNLRCLESFCDVVVTPLFPTQDNLILKATRFFWSLWNYSGGLSPSKKFYLLEKIKNQNFDGIFIDQSFYGRLAHEIKQLNLGIPIITNFHNIEKKYYRENKSAPFFTRSFLGAAAGFNEQLAVQASDHLLCLCEEDKSEIVELYGASRIVVLPPSLESEASSSSWPPSDPPILLFCGSYFAPNIKGLKWFVQNVLPHLRCELHIIGYKMERLKFSSAQIKNHGTTNEILPFYRKAIAVINPTFSDSGMKIKTLEALKYGKAAFGTAEAWRGVRIPDELPLFSCNSADEFIREIQNHLQQKNPLFHPEVKTFFDLHFSDGPKILKLKQIMENYLTLRKALPNNEAELQVPIF